MDKREKLPKAMVMVYTEKGLPVCIPLETYYEFLRVQETKGLQTEYYTPPQQEKHSYREK